MQCFIKKMQSVLFGPCMKSGFCNYDVRGYLILLRISARGDFLVRDLICNYVVRKNIAHSLPPLQVCDKIS